jgi:hypothetical protein
VTITRLLLKSICICLLVSGAGMKGPLNGFWFL